MPEINKVIYGSNTLVDLTDADAEAGDIVSGKKAYLASGVRATGTLDSKQASSGGTDLSLVTTGEKYDWNGKASVQELTKAQYNALTEAQKNNGTIYMITDDDGGWEAERSVYDNSDSGLTATNVQDAVDEIVSEKADALSVTNVDFNSLTKTGLYYMESPSANAPDMDVPFTVWEVTVIANTSGTVIKQIARAVGEYSFEFERHYTGGSWKPWFEILPLSRYNGNYSTTESSFRNHGSYAYGAFILIGTAGGLGGFAILGVINNSEITSLVNLATGTAWNSQTVTVTYTVYNFIGYLHVKTGAGGSRVTVLWG